VIKLRNIGLKGLLRRQAARDFDRNRELYRMRGVGEAPFGGFAVRYESRTRCRLPKTRAIDSLLMVIAHNLRTYARARAIKRMEIFICYRFIRQPPQKRKSFMGIIFSFICAERANREGF
jgi:hypothetical protein